MGFHPACPTGTATRHVGAQADARRRHPLRPPALEPGGARRPNPQPPPRKIGAYTAEELDARGAELGAALGPIVPFAAATACARPSGRARNAVTSTGPAGCSPYTARRRRAAAARSRSPRRRSPRSTGSRPGSTPRSCSPPPGAGIIHLDIFRRRAWQPAVEASGIDTPARIYDLRSTFATNALAAGLTIHELARVMGTPVRMIELHYGALVDGAHEAILARLEQPGRRFGATGGPRRRRAHTAVSVGSGVSAGKKRMERTGIEPVTSGLQTHPIARPHLTPTDRTRMAEPKLNAPANDARQRSTAVRSHLARTAAAYMGNAPGTCGIGIGLHHARMVHRQHR
jgi:hypothetical protein